jgi:hypothetical protein
VRIVFKAETSTRQMVDSWILSLGATRQERRRHAVELMTRFHESIHRGEGVPLGAVFDPTTRPPTYWCHLSPGWLARIHVAAPVRDWRTLWLTRYRAVTLVAVWLTPGQGR